MTITEGKITISFDNKDIEAIGHVAELFEELDIFSEKAEDFDIASFKNGDFWQMQHDLYNLYSALKRNNVFTFERKAE